MFNFLHSRINYLRRIVRQRRALKTVKSHKGQIFVSGKKNSKTYLSNNTILSNNPNFNGMIIKGNGCITFGDNFHSGEGCLIITQIHNYDKGITIPYDSSYIYKDVIIEDNVWLGDRVIILGGVIIGEGAIIQAGAVVASNIPKLAIAGGSPAKVFKYRDSDHYYKLKDQKLFH